MDKVEIGISEDVGNSIWDLLSRAGGTSECPIHWFLEKFLHKGISAVEMIPKVAAFHFSSNRDVEDLWSSCCNYPNHDTTDGIGSSGKDQWIWIVRVGGDVEGEISGWRF